MESFLLKPQYVITHGFYLVCKEHYLLMILLVTTWNVISYMKINVYDYFSLREKRNIFFSNTI